MGREELIEAAWRTMRLGVRCPARQPTWDVILVTAASPNQARLYQLQLQRAVDRGRIAKNTLVLAVPDPQGQRIGSGGATLGAIRQLAAHLRFKDDVIAGKRVLLVHAGGDSKRVPWANAIGKAFLPLPILTQDGCADEPVPSLFDHILAVSSLAAPHLPNRGGLLIMTGDVLPCFDASKISLPTDGALVVTAPVSLEVAANHGVILSQHRDEKNTFSLVEDLLQKPSIDEMLARGAVFPNSTALLDTGIFVVVGAAWDDLIQTSLAERDPVQLLLDNSQEMSLYEEIAGAWVSARHEWLRTRPLGFCLIEGLGRQHLYHYCAYDFKFLHFGTSSEILQHLATDDLGPIQRRQFSSVQNRKLASRLAVSSVILASEVEDDAAVGENSLVFNSRLSSVTEVGSNCVVLGVQHTESCPRFCLPDKQCLWEVPLKDHRGQVMLCCGLQDNPKLPADQGGTFCGRTWEQVFKHLLVGKLQVWTDDSSPQDLWHAKLFPILPSKEVDVKFLLTMWLIGAPDSTNTLGAKWSTAKRLSLSELQEFTDFEAMHSDMSTLQAKLATGFAKASLEDGVMDRNFSLLTREVLFGDNFGIEACKELLSLIPDKGLVRIPASRTYQVRADLTRGSGDKISARVCESNACQAVAAETSVAVCQDGILQQNLFSLRPSKSSSINLPVRLDIVGGWSDTPPWSIERKGCVLNMAVYLNGAAPVGAEILLKRIPGLCLRDDSGNTCWIEEPTSIKAPFDECDPFRLVKAALVVTGWTSQEKLKISPWGLEIKTRSAVPRGSGLGTSSILAAAVIRGLLEVSGGNTSNDNVAALVLVLEQLMGTGGGWQDQVGGIYPGLKCTTSTPEKLTFSIDQIPLSADMKNELEDRMLLVFTGQVRLAQKVLHKVVKRYLQRDSLLLSSIQRLVKLAKMGQEAFVQRNLDIVGKIMQEAWQIHQELDPFCSNVLVDAIFKKVSHLSCGYKLVGAGGGGFAIIMAKDRDSIQSIREVLTSNFKDSIEFYTWRLV